MGDNVVILGASGHAKVIIDIFRKRNDVTLSGLICDVNLGKVINDCVIIGTTSALPELSEKYKFRKGVIAIGNNNLRKAIKDKVTELVPDFEFVCAVHPKANISNFVEVGGGSVIMAGVTVNSNCTIGEHCILNTNSSLDHDSTMDDFAQLGPGVNTGGNVVIGRMSFVGIGSSIAQNVKIGNNTVVGAASFVNKNIGNDELGYGIPYNKVRAVEESKVVY